MIAVNIVLLVFYGLVLLLQLYTTRSISSHEITVENLRKINLETWTL